MKFLRTMSLTYCRPLWTCTTVHRPIINRTSRLSILLHATKSRPREYTTNEHFPDKGRSSCSWFYIQQFPTTDQLAPRYPVRTKAKEIRGLFTLTAGCALQGEESMTICSGDFLVYAEIKNYGNHDASFYLSDYIDFDLRVKESNGTYEN